MKDINYYTNKIRNCDCIDLMQQMPKWYIDLIYIDPPFWIKLDEKFWMEKWSKTNYISTYSSIIDLFPINKWEKSYLNWLYPRLALMRELLSETGSIYVHIDWHVGHYVKIMLDDIFGKENMVNEIIRAYTSWWAWSKWYSKKHDVLFFYSKNNSYYYETIKYKRYLDRSKWYNPYVEYYKESDWREYSLNVPTDVWNDIGIISTNWFERVNYATQKPEKLLERILQASCPEWWIVADFFWGSGTTAAVAEKLGRKRITSDIGKPSAMVMRKRLNKEIFYL